MPLSEDVYMSLQLCKILLSFLSVRLFEDLNQLVYVGFFTITSWRGLSLVPCIPAGVTM